MANQADIVIVGDLTQAEAESIAKDISSGLPVNNNIKAILDVKQVEKEETRISHPAKRDYQHIEGKNQDHFFS